ncbi:hypothetical protein GY45DRAFT_1359668 [Cubamyces sp. BRFM 1775]|nr:hypothetical protein GY45DRAFT_1359668 [Cubamyces sp. BRFM 1775]
MEPVYETLKTLQAALVKVKTKDKKRLTETVAQLSSHLVLLKLQILSNQVADKLSSFLRDTFSTLYASIELPALRLASSIFIFTYHERLLPTIGTIQREQQHLWERVLYGLLAGILDFLDMHDKKGPKDAVGEALYPALSDMCFSLTAPKTCVDIRCTAYNILCDSAASHQVNQQRLRDKDVLGGERLGWCIWRTKDYLALEGLLNVFARALPSTHNTASGRAKRTAYIQSVFITRAPPELTSTGRIIADLLENVPTSDWEETALKIVDVLAKANITFPQPFNVNEVIACGVRCPSDRLYADVQTFLANVLLEDGQYESLEIAHSSITHIGLKDLGKGGVQVCLSLEWSPKLGKDNIKEDSGSDCLHDASALFTINANDRNRFLKTLESRELDHLLLDGAPPSALKLSIATKPANLELDHAGRMVPELSQEERIETVAQFYKTDEPSDDITSSEGVGDMKTASDLLSPVPQAGEHADRAISTGMAPGDLVSERHLPAMDQNGSMTSGLDRKSPLSAAGPLSRTSSHLIRAAVFGLSDEELSDISDCDSPIPRSKALKRSDTGTSLVRGRLSFQPFQTKSTGTSSSATRVARGGIGIVVLDSDDDSPRAAPVSPRARRSKKAALIRPPTMDCSQVVSAVTSAPNATAIPAPAALTLDALAQPAVSSPLPGDHTLVSSDILGKVLRFSDIPAPDFNAPLSSPAIMPRSALKSAFAKKNAVPGRLLDLKVLDSIAATKETQRARSPSPVDNATESTARARNILDDLAPASSSPTPGPKKSVKANLRKRDEVQITVVEVTKFLSTKRKHAASQTPAEIEPLVDLDNGRATKRPRTVVPAHRALGGKEDAAPPTVIANERSESQVLRPRTTAATRATRKYHARKGRTSSPPAEAPLVPIHASVGKRMADAITVDYDALPSPPRASNAPLRPSSPVPTIKPRAKLKAKVNVMPTGGPKPQAFEGPAHSDTTQAPAAAPTRKLRVRKNERAAEVNREHVETSIPTTTEDVQPEVTTREPATSQRRPKRLSRARSPRTNMEEHTFTQSEIVPPSDHMNICAEHHLPSIECVAETTSVSPYKAEGSGPGTITTAEPGRPAGQRNLAIAADKNPRRSVKKSTIPPWDYAFEGRDSLTVDVARAHDVPTLDSTSTMPNDEPLVPVAHDHHDEEIAPASEIMAVMSSAERAKFIEKAKLSVDDPASLREDAEVRRTAATHEARTMNIPNARGDDAAARQRPVIEPLERLSTRLPPQPLPCSPIRTKKEVEMIDLTLDTPSKPVAQGRDVDMKHEGRPTSPVLSADAIVTAKTHYPPADDVLAFLAQDLQEDDTKPRFRPVQLAREDDMNTGYLRHVQHRHTEFKIRSIRERELDGDSREKIALEGKYRVSPPMESFVNVIEQLHEVIVYNMENKLEGVRHKARLGRNELLRDASEDLCPMRAESVEHFNRLVDLEAEYATAGRSLIHGSEDWLKVSQEVTKELKAAVEVHDRTLLSKKIPTSLITLTF